MRPRKQRLTVTVDADVLSAVNDAVAGGGADSVSGWVNAALAERLARERRLRAMAEAVDAYEARHGVMSAAEIAEQLRADRRAAVVVRGRIPKGRRR